MSKLYVKNSRIKYDNTIKSKLVILALNTVINISVAFMICLILFIADADVDANYPLITAALCFSEFVTAYISGRKLRKNGIIVGVLFNIPFVLSEIVIALALSSFEFDYRLFLSLFTQITISAIGGIVSVNTRKRSK